MVTSAVGTCDDTVPMPPPGKNGALIVGTIRMGFGHHRIAYAASSWGIASGRTTYFHDLLNDVGREQVMDDIVAWIEVRL
jgi:hypothetical protein